MFEQPRSLLDPDEIPDGLLPAPLLPDLATSKGSKPDVLSDNLQPEPEAGTVQQPPGTQYGSPLGNATSLLTTAIEHGVDEAAALASVFSSIPDVAITNVAAVPEATTQVVRVDCCMV
jgi:hypothetical protein